MQTHTGIRWNYVMIALTAAGLLAAGAFFLRAGTAASAEEATAQRPPTEKPYKCGNVTVKVLSKNDQANMVEPETFTACQDHPKQNEHFKVTWERADNSITSFTVYFQADTPFEKNHGNPDTWVSVFTMNESGRSIPQAYTRNLNLDVGQHKYYKYRITVCYVDDQGTTCDTQDPGGIIRH